MTRLRLLLTISSLALVLAFAARGSAAGTRIVGGYTASPGTFGFMAFVVDTQPDGTVELCSGTVIAPNIVLTAGHCGEDTTTGIVNSGSQFAVVTGTLDWTDPATRQVSGVSQVIVNPDFDPSTLNYDATLLILATPTSAPTIPLATDPQDLSLLNAGTRADIAGWGETATEIASTQLQWSSTIVQSDPYCSNQASLLFGASFDEYTQTCAVDAPSFGDSTCSGDSGGPLLAQNAAGQWIEIGITSSGDSECDTADPQYFSRADAISAWAESEIAAVPPSTPSTTPPPAIGTPTTTMPTVTTAPHPTHPLAGTYRGKTSQHQPVQLKISASTLKLTSLTFGFTLKCSRRRTPTYTFSPFARGSSWTLNTAHGFGYDRTFRDATGEQYRMTASFTPAGVVAGTLSTSWRSPRYGSCSSGTVHWSATNSQLTSR